MRRCCTEIGSHLRCGAAFEQRGIAVDGRLQLVNGGLEGKRLNVRLEVGLGKVGEQTACLLHLLPLRHLLDAGVWLGGIVERGGSSFLCGNGALLGTADGRKNVGYQVSFSAVPS